jgi:hypothetical protein
VADQTFNNVIAVEDQATPALEQYQAQWEGISAAQAAAAESASTITEATGASEGAISSAAVATESLAESQSGAVTSSEEMANAQTHLVNSNEELNLSEKELEKQERKLEEERKLMYETLAQLIEGNANLVESFGELGLQAMVVMTAFNKLKEIVTEYVSEGKGAEEANAAMTATFQANTTNAEEQISTVEAAATSFGKYGLTVTEVEDIMSKMTPAVHDADTELRAVKDAADLAAAAHIDVAQAATLVTRAMEGGGAALHRYGVYIDSTARGTQVLDAIEQKFGDTADQVANTGAGAINRLDAAQKNLNEDIGTHFVDATKSFNEAETQVLEGIDAGVRKGDNFAIVLGSLDSLFSDIPFKIAGVEQAFKNWITGYDATKAATDEFVTTTQNGMGKVQESWAKSASDATVNAENVGAVWSKAVGRDVPEALAQEMGAQQASQDAGARYAMALKNVNETIRDDHLTTKDQVIDAFNQQIKAFQSLVDEGADAKNKNNAAIQEQAEFARGKIGEYIDALTLLQGGYDSTAKAISTTNSGMVLDTKQTMDAITKELDIAEAAQAAAHKSGEAYATGWDTALADAEAIVHGHVTNILGMVGAAEQAIAQMGQMQKNAAAENAKAALESGGYFNTVTRTLSTSTQTTAAAQAAYQTPEQIRATYLEHEKYLKAFEDAHGYNPITGATVAGGGGGAKGGKGGGAKGGTGPSAATLEEQAQQLQLTKDHTTASQAQAAATKMVAEVNQSYTTDLQKVNDAIQKNIEANAADTNLLKAKAQLKGDQAAETAQKQADAKAANDLTVAIHETTGVLKELDREAAVNMAPLEANLKRDTAAMNELSQATQAMDHQFTDTLNNLQNQAYDLAQEAAKDMAPYQASLDQANAAYKAAQENVQNLQAAEADKLFPIEQQLTKIAQERAGIQLSNTMDQEAQSVANLGARLKDLVPGSAEYNAVLKEQSTAYKNLQLDEQTAKLTKQKDAVTNTYSAQIHAAEEQAKAAAAQQKAAQAAFDAQKKIEDQEKANLDERIAAIQHEQSLYDQQQADKQYAAQQNVNADNVAIASQQALDTARAQTTKDYLANLQSEQAEESYQAGQHNIYWQNVIGADQDAVAKLQAPYDDQKTRLEGIKQAITDQKTAYDESVAPILTDLGKIKDGTQTALDVFKNNVDAAKEADAWSKAVAAGGAGLQAMHDAGPNVAGDIAAIKSASGDATTTAQGFADTFNNQVVPAMGSFANSMNTVVGPAIGNLGSTVAPGLTSVMNQFQTAFGDTSNPNFDPNKSIAWLVSTHNTEGFPAKWAEQWKIFFTKQGLGGIIDLGLQYDWTIVKDSMSAEAAAIEVDSKPIGENLMSGISQGVSEDSSVNGLAGAIVAAVNKAMGQAQAQLGIHSPSEVSRRLLGQPLGQGVALGVADTQALVTESVRRLVTLPGLPTTGGAAAPAGDTYIIQTLSIPITTPLPTDPNKIGDQVADAFIYALDRRSKGRGLTTTYAKGRGR